MKLYIMKKEALETLKSNLDTVYGKYYTEKTNSWINEICGENPFVEYKDITEFKLADLDSDLTPGEIDINNCKIIYENLQFLSESQASDERLWAGLTHTVFYGYMRKRWGYGYGKRPKSAEKEIGAIRTRFFYHSSGRSGFYRNTLAKCWWVGHNTYDAGNEKNHFQSLDIIGSSDFSSKINELFYNFTFSSNPYVMAAIIEAFRRFNQEGKRISVREHIRPALSYLNAVGGSVVIDCLEKEEITRIFSDAVDAIMQGDSPTVYLGSELSLENDDAEEDSALDESSDVPEVVLGCKIAIRDENGKTTSYRYENGNNGQLLKTLEVFTGRKVGDTVEIKGKNWTIEDIIF